MEMPCKRKRGKPKITYMAEVKDDMQLIKLTEDDEPGRNGGLQREELKETNVNLLYAGSVFFGLINLYFVQLLDFHIVFATL